MPDEILTRASNFLDSWSSARTGSFSLAEVRVLMNDNRTFTEEETKVLVAYFDEFADRQHRLSGNRWKAR